MLRSHWRPGCWPRSAWSPRGLPGPRGRDAALRAERLARGLDDPVLLAFCLNGVFLQSFHRAGLAARRDAIGADLVALAARHGIAPMEILGRLVRMQACCALGDVAGADEHARAADELAARHAAPLVVVFTTWYRALRLALTDGPSDEVAAAYRRAAALLPDAGMPGLADGMLPLAPTAEAVRSDRPVPQEAIEAGPYTPWTRPLALLDAGDRRAAADALDAVPSAPQDHLLEVRCALLACAAHRLRRSDAVAAARAALSPAAGEQTAGSGVLTAGPVNAILSL